MRIRHPKLVVYLAVLAVGTLLFFEVTLDNSSVRGPDANIETRGTNTAGQPLVGTAGTTNPASGSTSGFISEAAERNATEAALADLAQRRATSAAVKRYAAELLRDHKAASFTLAAASAGDAELKAFAAKQLPALQRHLDHARTLN